MTDSASLGEWIRRRRRALDLTREALAQQVGCAVVTIRKIESDERRPSRQVAERLAECLQIPADQRAAFLQAARAELAADRLPDPPVPASSDPATLLTPRLRADAQLPGGTVTFLFTDIEGSTKLWEQYPQVMPAALARHDAILRQAVEQHGGVVFKTVGDAICAAFGRASDALAAALTAQRVLQTEPWSATPLLLVRMALHTGAAEQRDNDYFGPPLNRVTRLLSVGHGGQVLLSLATAELVREHLLAGATLQDLGRHRLKDLGLPEQIFQLAAPDLPAEFPALKTLDARRSNLPAHPTPLLGRAQELAAVGVLLQRDDTRLVTLTGPGGTGKTRLALQLGVKLLDTFADGVWFVDLAPLSDPSLLMPTILQTLGLKEVGGHSPTERLQSYLCERQSLLILDNFEQVVNAAPQVAKLLAAAARLKVLVTSRVVLRLRGEQEYTVLPLALPDLKQLPPPETFSQYAAVELFIQRAQAAKPDFQVTNASAPAVAEICHRLDGLPLAIELAAARVKLFSPQAFLVRLEKRLTFLTGGARDLPARQQTIRNAIDWSYHLLEEGEKLLFARLGVFVGGYTLEAAEAVAALHIQTLERSNVVDGMAALVDKSLLRQEEGPVGEPRFTMLETIREYALERLEASGEAEAQRHAHAEYFLALAEEAEPLLHGRQQRAWLDRLEAEHDNLRAALRWMVERHATELALRLGAALGWFWFVRGYDQEGLQWLEAALAQSNADRTPARAWALRHAAQLSWSDGRRRTHWEDALVLFRELDDKPGIARALTALGFAEIAQGNNERGEALLSEHLALAQELGDTASLADATQSKTMLALMRGDDSAVPLLAVEHVALRRQVGDPQTLCWALNVLGETSRLLGDNDRAVAAYEEALALARELNSWGFVATILSNIGFVVQRKGNHERAATLFGESLAVSREWGFEDLMTCALTGLAGVAVARSQLDLAGLLLGAVEVLVVRHDVQLELADRADYDRIVAAARAAIGKDAFTAVWEAGQALTLEQAITYALGAGPDGTAPLIPSNVRK